MLQKRLREHVRNQAQNGESQSNKRQKKSVADELVCPITLELPWEPVTAEDGRVYERQAIEEHFKTVHGSRELKSPITNENMGKRLLPAPHIRNLIEVSVENGYITGALADSWNKKAKEKKDMEDLLKKAESGDSKAMCSVGNAYFHGKNGFVKDEKLAYSWCKKAHEAGNVQGTACVGWRLFEGRGVAKSQRMGMVYTSMAAGQGSNLAAYYLGKALALGEYGLPVDKSEAIHWLQKSLNPECPYRHMSDWGKNDAQRILNDLTGNSQN